MKKRNAIIYWIATLWFSLGMISSGILQLFKVQAEGALSPPGVYGMLQLGYPLYMLTLLGIWKVLGVVALIMPGFRLLKEWAYAGFFFLMSGAIFSHLAVGHPVVELLPSILLLILLALSWYFRSAERRIISNT